METIVGIVDTEDAARRIAADVLRAEPKARIRILTPGDRPETLAQMPTDDAEQPGMGAAIGAVTGGATGASAAILLAPPIGAIAIAGIAAGALLGGLAGAVTGHAIEEAGAFGLPRDELFVYANALREGRCVLLGWVEGDAAATVVHRVLDEEPVDSVDAAREKWWIGLRGGEAAAYGDRFVAEEAAYRQGFEAACRHEDPPTFGSRHPAFRAGYARGRAYVEARTRSAATASAPAPRTAPL